MTSPLALKLAMVRVFIPWKSANTINQVFKPRQIHYKWDFRGYFKISLNCRGGWEELAINIT